MLKNLIKAHPFLFFFWYHLYRKYRGVPIEFFSSNTKLYLDGYPRSGNTYSLHLIKTLWPDLSFVHHFHSIAPIKIALQKRVPVFILVRDPMNAISSAYLKELSLKGRRFNKKKIDISFLNNLAKNYIIYYRWVVKYRTELELIQFKELVNNPDLIMKRINNSLSKSLTLKDRQIHEGLEIASKTGFGARDRLGASLPTKEKERDKKILKEVLTTTNNYELCLEVFDELQTE